MKLFTPEQAAALLHISPRLVRRYCAQGRLGQRVGKHWVIRERELNSFSILPRPRGRKPKENKS